MTSPALMALLAAIHDRRATLPEPIVSLAEIVAREFAAQQEPESPGARRTGGVS